MYPYVFFGGRWVSSSQAVIPVGSLAMRYGISVFEGIRLYSQQSGARPQPFLLDQHIDRLVISLALMRLSNPGVEILPSAVDELIERNEIDQDAYVRVAVSPTNSGDLTDEGEPVLTVTAAPMGRKRWLEHDIAMKLMVSEIQRSSPHAFPPAAKNISCYAGARLAALAARDAGFDGCVLLNRAGRLCESPTATLFLVCGGELLTPALSEDVLPGITRAWLLKVAAMCGIDVRETELTREHAYEADEAFLCGTGIEIAPISGFDGQECRQWLERPITRLLTGLYFAKARGADHHSPVACTSRPSGPTR